MATSTSIVQNANDSVLSTTGTETGEEGEPGTEEDDVEEFVWNLMAKTGLLSELKSRIALFIQQHGSIVPGVSVIPSRADPIILQPIYEYLNWVGMKNTAALLVTESPVNIDMLTSLGENENPSLCTLFQNLNKSEPPVEPSAVETPINNKTFISSKFQETPVSKNRDESKNEQKSKGEEMENPLLNESFDASIASMQSGQVDSPVQSPQESINGTDKQENGDISNDNEEDPAQGKTKPEEEDDSLSGLLDSVQLDDNTQDVSIASSKGMSSCEHIVNLK